MNGIDGVEALQEMRLALIEQAKLTYYYNNCGLHNCDAPCCNNHGKPRWWGYLSDRGKELLHDVGVEELVEAQG